VRNRRYVRKNVVPTFVVDRSPLFRAGLQLLLENTPFAVVSEGPDLASVLDHLRKTDSDHLLLLAVDQDSRSPIETLRLCRNQFGFTKVIVLADRASSEDLTAFVDAGAHGYLLRYRIGPQSLLSTLELVAEGETVFPRELMDGIRLQASRTGDVLTFPTPIVASSRSARSQPVGDPAQLTGVRSFSGREELILHELVRGASNKQIARALGMAEATVKVHVKSILKKVRVRNRTQAAMWAIQYFVPTASETGETITISQSQPASLAPVQRNRVASLSPDFAPRSSTKPL
jgi:two-component system nitrate/nitrite response regulator NarL